MKEAALVSIGNKKALKIIALYHVCCNNLANQLTDLYDSVYKKHGLQSMHFGSKAGIRKIEA